MSYFPLELLYTDLQQYKKGKYFEGDNNNNDAKLNTGREAFECYNNPAKFT